MKRIYLFYLIIGLSTYACQPVAEQVDKEDVLLAKAHNQSLYLSELEDMFPSGTKEDSLLFLNAYVERWVRKRLMLHEAELNIPNDVNIDQLVRDYRSTLVLHNYEQGIIENELDSTINEAQIQAFYEQNKDEYQLKNPIIRCRFMKVPLTAPNLEEVEEWWKSEDEEDIKQLVEFCDKHAETYYLNERKWFEVSQISKYMPPGKVSNASVKSQKEYTHEDDNYAYWLSILEVVSNNEPLPLGYIENRAKKVILHQRKTKLIEARKEAIYERELNKNNVQIYKKYN